MIDRFDIVRVPFPFSDMTGVKTRPALVVSSAAAFNRESRHVALAMITSAARSSFPLDVPLKKPLHAGLLKPSLVRMKLVTVDTGLILEHIGALHASDRQNVASSLRRLLAFLH